MDDLLFNFSVILEDAFIAVTMKASGTMPLSNFRAPNGTD
jgi:hypothetical protein